MPRMSVEPNTSRRCVATAGFAMGLLAMSTAAWPADQPSSAVIARAAEVLAREHVAKPDLASIPRDADGFVAYLTKLDPYSELVPTAEASPDRDRKGLGATSVIWRDASFVPPKDKLVLVPMAGGPVARAGVVGPQIVLAGNGVSFDGMSVKAMRSVLATDALEGAVTLRLRDPILKVTREVQVEPASYRIPDIGLTQVAGADVITIYEIRGLSTRAKIEAALKGSAATRRVILDLRYQQGGDLIEGIDVAGAFLREGTKIASTVDASGLRRDYAALKGTKFVQSAKQVTVLIGPWTASTSEILVRALAADGATTIGQKTAGKCTAQVPRIVGEGWTLWVSIFKILGPDGAYCNGVGVAPKTNVAKTEQLLDLAALVSKVGVSKEVSAPRTSLAGVYVCAVKSPAKAGDAAAVASSLRYLAVRTGRQYVTIEQRLCVGPHSDVKAAAKLAGELTQQTNAEEYRFAAQRYDGRRLSAVD